MVVFIRLLTCELVPAKRIDCKGREAEPCGLLKCSLRCAPTEDSGQRGPRQVLSGADSSDSAVTLQTCHAEAVLSVVLRQAAVTCHEPCSLARPRSRDPQSEKSWRCKLGSLDTGLLASLADLPRHCRAVGKHCVSNRKP